MRLKKLLALLLSVMMILSSFTVAVQAATPQIKNIIFMIPDGGSMVPFYLADAVKQAGGIKSSVAPYATKQTVNKMYMKDYLIGAQKTYCADNAITDSAAAGTALAGGYKTNTYHIGLKPDMTPRANVLEAAQSVGKKVGMVATFEFSNATPAAFSAHESHRDHYPSISRQIAYQGIDVLLGGGFSKSEWNEAQSTVASLGYNIIDNRAELNAVKQGDKIWGNLFSGQAASDHQNTASDVTLAEMTTAAIRALENDNGFFLMVEGSNVDGGGHDNNGLEMVGEFIAFDEACKIAVEYAKGRNDTLVIMMPDHDTGGMNVINQTTAVNNIQNGVIPGTSALTWDSKQHTARNGGVFLYAPAGVAYPAGLSTNPGVASNFDNYVVENTVFAPYLANLMGVDLDYLTSELFVDVTSLGIYAPYTVNYSHRNLGTAMSSNEHTGIFTFKSVNASIERNTSILKYNGQSIDLDGQVSVYENGRFYVPYKALDILGLEAPEGSGSGSSIPHNVITTESLYSMGTAGSLWGDVNEYNGATGSGNSITIQPGGYVTFKVPVPKAGIYYLQVKSSGGNTTLEAQMNYQYVAELPVSSADAYYYKNAEGGYEFLYGARGSNKMQLTNTGSEAVTLTSVELIASQVAVDNGVTPTIADVKTVSYDVAVGDAAYSTNAPFAGVYQVKSDKAVTITNETGHTATLAANSPSYFYLIKGANKITKSDPSAKLTFNVLANNGMDYIGQVNAGTAPLATAHSDQVAIPGGTNMAVGAESKVLLEVPASGIYYVSLQSPDKKVSTIHIKSDTGYYGEMTPYTGNLQYAVNEANPKELITMYLREGTTTLTLKNQGAGTANLTSIQVKQTQELTGIAAYISQLNIAHCKVIPMDEVTPDVTPIPTPVPTPGPVVTPGPDGWNEGDVASASGAPYAGVYKVYSDKAVTITNETGHTATLQPNVVQYFYLIKGANNITKSDASANLTFTVLKNNGMDYINNVNAGTAPTHNSNTYFGPSASANGATTSSFVDSTSGSVTASGDTITLAPGASVTFKGNIATAGLYYIQVQFTANGTNKLDLETSSGHYAQINQHRTGWNYYYDISTYDMDPVYMRSGVETLTITNTGSTTCSFTGIRFARTSSTDIAYAMKLANCKVVPVTVGDAPANPTPIPTATPVPTPANQVAYTAPCAGVFSVSSDKAVTLTNETGHSVTLAAGATGKLYLVKGQNTMTSTDTSATLTFSALDNQGIDYISSVTMGDFKIAENDVYYTTTLNVPANSSVSVSMNVPASGMYYLSYYKLTGATNQVYNIETDTGFYGAVKNTTVGWNHFGLDGTVEYAYLRAGDNTVTVTNPTNAAITIDQVRLSKTSNYSQNLGWDNVKIIMEEVVEPTPTATPTPTVAPTQAPTATPTPTEEPVVTPAPGQLTVGTAIDYSDAPYAGVYKVTSDKAVTITNETGHTATLAAGAEQYFYLVKGANNITKSNASATLTFTVLKNNGMDYISEVNAGTTPIVNNNVYMGPAGNSNGQTPVNFLVSTEGSVSTTSDTVVIGAGASATFKATNTLAGLYYVQLQVNSDDKANLIVETNTGHYAEINQYQWGWNAYCGDSSLKDYEPVYLREGEVVITITNTSNVAAPIGGIRMSRSSSVSTSPEVVLAKCKVIPVEVADAPVLVDEFKGFTLNGDTATVNYTKATNTDPEAITLYIAEYAGNKLVQVNLVVIDTTDQAVGTTEDYSVSLLSASSGNVKAMLLDANLVPLF